MARRLKQRRKRNADRRHREVDRDDSKRRVADLVQLWDSPQKYDVSGHTLGLQIVTVYTMGRGRTLGSRYGKRSVLLSCDTSNMQQKEYFQNPEDRRRTRKTAGSNFKTANRFR